MSGNLDCYWHILVLPGVRVLTSDYVMYISSDELRLLYPTDPPPLMADGLG